MSLHIYCRDHDLVFRDYFSALQHLMKEQHDGGHDARIYPIAGPCAIEPVWWCCEHCDPHQFEYGDRNMWQHLQEWHKELLDEWFGMVEVLSY
ncbi:hypothetical protein N7454_005491 [Penicillium verhagenii]|nr:hypothetical protein N7454_005491 [Penicillium verhagenii]